MRLPQIICVMLIGICQSSHAEESRAARVDKEYTELIKLDGDIIKAAQTNNQELRQTLEKRRDDLSVAYFYDKRNMQRSFGTKVVDPKPVETNESAMGNLIPAEAKVAQKITIPQGTIEVIADDPDSDYGKSLVFNGHFVYVKSPDGKTNEALEADFLKIKKIFPLGGKEVVIAETQCAGSSCSWKTLFFFTISSPNDIVFSGTAEESDGQEAAFNSDGKQITFATINFDGRTKTTKRWSFADGKLSPVKMQDGQDHTVTQQGTDPLAPTNWLRSKALAKKIRDIVPAGKIECMDDAFNYMQDMTISGDQKVAIASMDGSDADSGRTAYFEVVSSRDITIVLDCNDDYGIPIGPVTLSYFSNRPTQQLLSAGLADWLRGFDGVIRRYSGSKFSSSPIQQFLAQKVD
jgi:hypothetical protein